MKGDLHTHSTFSDSCIPIEKLPRMAAWAGLTHLAVTDHDTFQSVDYALANPVVQGVNLIPGVELSAWDFVHDRKVHLLCYAPDKTPGLIRHVEQMALSRNRQQRQTVEKLLRIYPFLDEEEILTQSEIGGVAYKAHIMHTLHRYGLTPQIYGKLFHTLFGKDGSCATPETYRVPVEELLEQAHQANATVILAHPGVYDSVELVADLAKRSLIDGVEIHHPGNTPAVQIALKNMAMQYDLIITGGTDYHGVNEDYGCLPGAFTTSETHLKRLLETVAKRHKI